MSAQDVAMLIADISGYTRFTVEHGKAIAHSQSIVTELLQAIVAQARAPLKVSKFEGDAVFMYAVKNDAETPEKLQQAMRESVEAMFCSHAQLVASLAGRMICRCAACKNLGDLKLKIVVHSGSAMLIEMGQTELQGLDPIVIHRLLKNNVDSDEYLLLTATAKEDIEPIADMPFVESIETYGDIGEVPVWVGDPTCILNAEHCELVDVEESELPWEMLRGEIKEEYADIVSDPHRDFHFHTGLTEATKCEYPNEFISSVPSFALTAFLGTGNPFAMGEMPEGANVIDIGCGAGMDLTIASRQIGPKGRVIGIDMTEAMITAGRKTIEEAGLENAEVREGYAEHMPIEDEWADVIISNGAFNLCPDKPKVLAEMFRVLKPGGKIQIGDIIVPRPLRFDERQNIDLWKG